MGPGVVQGSGFRSRLSMFILFKLPYQLLQLVDLGLLVIDSDRAQADIAGVKNGVGRLRVYIAVQQHIGDPVDRPAHFPGAGHLQTLCHRITPDRQ